MNNFKKILIIGDTIIDKYIYVEPKKISDEAHVITSEISNIKYSLGGGANVARNISSQGHKCSYIGLTTREAKPQVTSLFKSFEIKPILFTLDNSIQTKTRIISSRGSQVFRFDDKISPIMNNKIKTDIISKIKDVICQHDFVIVSKYYDHFIDKEISKVILEECKKNKIKLLIDNRQPNHGMFNGADFYKMNFNEFKNFFDCSKINNNSKNIIDFLKLKDIPWKNLIITRSNLPTILFKKNKEWSEIIVNPVEVNDVSGAGDTFVSSFAIHYSDETDIIETIKKCHDMCNIVVKKLGTDVVWSYEFENELPLSIISKHIKMNGKKIVFTNGVFDILHEGHLKLLKEAKSHGDYLIVALNSDNSVKKIKGNNRPIKSEQERKKILESFSFVDKVIIFNKTTVDSLIRQLKPSVYVKGGDYNLKSLPEKKSLCFVEKVIFIDYLKGKSSTNMIKKIRGI